MVQVLRARVRERAEAWDAAKQARRHPAQLRRDVAQAKDWAWDAVKVEVRADDAPVLAYNKFMVRPRKRRRISGTPEAYYFKPRGVPLSVLQEVELTSDEVEALRLYHLADLDQQACAKKMQISQSTFHRILASAHHKLAQAIIAGHAIKITDQDL